MQHHCSSHELLSQQEAKSKCLVFLKVNIVYPQDKIISLKVNLAHVARNPNTLGVESYPTRLVEDKLMMGL